MRSIDIALLKSWEGRAETSRDEVGAWLAKAYRATFDLPAEELTPGSATPQGLHWCVAPPVAPASALGADGHPARGGFLPPVPLPRRMWAGGRVWFDDALRVGDGVERFSCVKRVELKQGRTGPLVFVLAEHRLSTARGVCVREEHDIVYRDVAPSSAPGLERANQQAAPYEPADLRRVVEPSSVLLFRYSALTFNGHKIHYDRRHAVEAEGYPGLIVHGPLQASLLIGLGCDIAGRPLKRFSFRAVKPLFDLAPFTVAGRRRGEELSLWCEDGEGERTMSAQAE
jgi:3-methylfumaryl-CoA hydratase